MDKFVQRRVAAAAAGEPSPQLSGGAWDKLYPALMEYMTQTVWAGGEARTTTSILLFTDGPVWKACLTDRDSEPRRVAFVSGPTPEALLRAVEAQLSQGTADWRDQYSGKKKGK